VAATVALLVDRQNPCHPRSHQASKPDDLTSQKALARACQLTGKIHGLLGDLAAGEAALREAVNRFTQLSRSHPEDVTVARDLINANQLLAVSVGRSGRHEEAMALSRSAMEELARLARALPDVDPGGKAEIALQRNVSMGLSSLDRTDEALKIDQQIRMRLERVVAEEPLRRDVRFQLAEHCPQRGCEAAGASSPRGERNRIPQSLAADPGAA
jgi:hypothetical protein